MLHPNPRAVVEHSESGWNFRTHHITHHIRSTRAQRPARLRAFGTRTPSEPARLRHLLDFATPIASYRKYRLTSTHSPRRINTLTGCNCSCKPTIACLLITLMEIRSRSTTWPVKKEFYDKPQPLAVAELWEGSHHPTFNHAACSNKMSFNMT